MRLIHILAAICVVLFASGSATADESVFNREGFWIVGRGEADSGSCFASLMTKSGGIFVLQAEGGALSFSVGAKRPLRGRKAELATEAYAFAFDPSFTDNGILVADGMNESAVAALRLASGLVVNLDGREVFSANVENTGLDGALDAVVACSQGKDGWWGKGVDPAIAEAEREGELNAEGYWKVRANPSEGSCTAVARVQSSLYMVLVSSPEGLSFGVSTSRTLQKGRAGLFETEAYSFEFPPSYDDNYLYFDDALGARGLAALRLARSLKISVDGRPIASMRLAGTGMDGVLDALTDCAAGKDGWWGPGLTEAGTAGGKSGPSRAGGSGTAFFISGDGLAITAAHVVAGCQSVEAPRWGAVKVIAVDQRADLAILKTSSASGQSLALRGRGPRLGEAVSAAGYPLGGLLGSGLKITTGVVSGLSGPQGDRGLFQISASIQSGNSGGPVVDASGALVGITVAKLDEVELVKATGEFPQNVNFAVPATVLEAFLDENGIAYRTAAAEPAARQALTGVTFSVACTR